jgi:hypothetical protein
VRKQHWAIPFVFLALGGGVLWLLFSRQPIEEGRCQLRRKAIGNPVESQFTALAWQYLRPESSRPDDVKDLPSDFAQPCFYHMDTSQGRWPVVVDLSHGQRLSFDTDRDGLFSDERYFRARSVRLHPQDGRRGRFGPVRIESGASGGQEAAIFYSLNYPTDQSPSLMVYPAYYWYGRLRIDGRVHGVAVVDGDHDGQFGSIVSPPTDPRWRWPCSDLFAIDRNGDGKFETSLYAHSSEVMPLSRMVLLDGSYYAIDVSPDGSRLGLAKTEPTLGHLAINPANAKLQLRLWSDAADQFLSPVAGSWDLPVGTYQTLYAVLNLPDSNGDNWTFSTLRDVGGLTSFKIQAGETTRLRVGPPFVVKAQVQRVGGGIISISPVVVGCAGEEYQADFRCNSRRAPERTFKIVDEKGTVLVADRFQYG